MPCATSHALLSWMAHYADITAYFFFLLYPISDLSCHERAHSLCHKSIVRCGSVCTHGWLGWLSDDTHTRVDYLLDINNHRGLGIILRGVADPFTMFLSQLTSVDLHLWHLIYLSCTLITSPTLETVSYMVTQMFIYNTGYLVTVKEFSVFKC